MSGVSVKNLCYEVSRGVGIVTGASSGLRVILAETLRPGHGPNHLRRRRMDSLIKRLRTVWQAEKT